MVPEGWKEKVFLKNLLRLDRGSSPRPIVNYITDGEGVNWIKIGDTRASTLTINSTKEKITVEGSKKSRAVYKGEIIVSNSMSYGKPYVLNIDGFIHDGWFVLREYEKKLSKLYLIQLLSSDIVQRQYKRLAAGGVVSNISSELVYSVKINVPPKTEQKKIAQILSTWDKAITTTEQLLANSQQQKKALMQQLLTGKKRLLDENGVRFSGEWEHGLLKDLADVAKGKALSSKNLIKGSYPVIAGGKISPYTHNDFTHEYSITVSASGAYAGYVAFHPYKFWASDCSVVRAKSSANTLFIYQVLSYLQNKIYSLQSGGAQPHIYPKDLQTLKINYPSFVEQEAIASVLTKVDSYIKLSQKKIEHLKAEKKALMQQLLTGKRRVKVDEEAA